MPAPAYDGQPTYDQVPQQQPYDIQGTLYDGGATYDSQTALYDSAMLNILSEAGTGSQTLSLEIEPLLRELAKGIESLRVIQQVDYDGASTYDGNYFYDVQAQNVLLADIGHGLDTIAQILRYLNLTETGKGVETITLSSPPITINVNLNEKTLSTAQTLSINNILPILVEGIPGYSINQSRLTYDYPVFYDIIKTGTDNISVTAKVTTNEFGFVSDIYRYDNNGVYDIVGQYSSPFITVQVNTILNELAKGTDVIIIQVPVTLTEAGSGVDTIVVLNNSVLSESGHGLDVIVISNPISLQEYGTGIDSPFRYDFSPTKYDIASLYDFSYLNPQITANLTQLERGAGTDVQLVTVTFSSSDFGHGADTVASHLGPFLEDFGVGADTISLLGAFATIAQLTNKVVTLTLANKNIVVTIKPQSMTIRMPAETH